MVPIPVAHIESARRKLLANASALIAEAELLLERSHRARAYALAHLACEELAKLPMLVRVGIQSVLGHSVDWHRLKRRLRNHKEKIDNLHGLDYMLSDIRPDNSDVTAYRSALETTPELNDLKNASLYVRVDEAAVVSPEEAISLEAARTMLAQARARLRFFEMAEQATAGRLEQMREDPTMVAFFDVLRRLESGEFD